MTLAAPTPRPPTTRHTIRPHTPKARPEPTAEMKNRIAAITITGIRPNRFERAPANQAPMAQPSSAEETAKPVSPAPRENSSESALTAPLITEVSKPNRNPPTAAAIEIPTTFAFRCWAGAGPAPDRGSGVDMAATPPRRGLRCGHRIPSPPGGGGDGPDGQPRRRRRPGRAVLTPPRRPRAARAPAQRSSDRA